MNLLSRLLAPSDARMTPDEFVKAYQAGTGTWANVTIDQDKALTFSVVWACVTLLADVIAAMPVHAYRRNDDSRLLLRPQPPYLDDVDAAPNPESDRFTWVFRTIESLAVDGNSYWCVADRDQMGWPSEIWNLHPNWVTPTRHNGRIVYDYAPPDGSERRTFSRYSRQTPGGEIIHIKRYDRGGLKGLSPIDAAREGIAFALAAEEYGARFFGQGAVPPGYFELQGDPGPGALDATKDWFEENYSGKQRAHKPAFLKNATWHPIAISPENAQFLESRKFQVSEVARWWRVPPHLAGDVEKTTTWGSGMEQTNRMFFDISLIPYVVRFESAVNSMRPAGEFVKVNPAGLLRGDLQTRYQAYKEGRAGGWLSVNDVHRLEDEEPVEGGDDYLIPMNTQSVAQQAASAELAAMRQRAETAGVLIRAGYKPEDVGPAVGLPDIPHTGLIPITVTPQEPANAPQP